MSANRRVLALRRSLLAPLAAAATGVLAPAGAQAALVVPHQVTPEVVTPQVSSAPAAAVAPAAAPVASAAAPVAPAPSYAPATSGQSLFPIPRSPKPIPNPSWYHPPTPAETEARRARHEEWARMSQAEKDQWNAEFKDWFAAEEARKAIHDLVGTFLGVLGASQDEFVVTVPESIAKRYSERQLVSIASGLGGKPVVVPGEANASAPTATAPSSPGGGSGGAGEGEGGGGDIPTEIEDPSKAKK